jgi:dTDP-D-glucose 4,6-dehydratase
VENEIYNISGGFEQSNLETARKIISAFLSSNDFDINEHVDFSFSRVGQDVRYALNDDKLKMLGWKSEAIFDQEISSIVKYYKNKFIW